MDDRRQKIQLELAWGEGVKGEAPKLFPGTESSAAKCGTESPANTESLMEEVSGVDGMTVQRLPGFLQQHWPAIRDQLLSGPYRPQPVRRVEIPKPDGSGVRRLGIPSVLDRFVQQAVVQVLQKRWDRTFSEHSYGFRPRRSAHQAVEAAQSYIASGYRWCVDLDLEKIFDRVSHEKLMAKIAERISDKRLLKLIRAFLTAGVLEGGLVSPVDEGTPQGGPLSPLLSNLVLDEFDRELERRGHCFARYADDCNIYVRGRRARERVMKSLTGFITTKLKLKVNETKSAVADRWERKFLGFSFTRQKLPKRRIAPKAVARFKERVRKLTRRTRGISIERMAKELAAYLRGWIGHFGKCQTPSVLKSLEEWMRRRLRSVIWKQWQRGTVRYVELRKRGVHPRLAATTAGSTHGPWRLALSQALAFALPNAYFDALGIPRLTVR